MHALLRTGVLGLSLAAAAPALAVDVSLGVGAGISVDFNDTLSESGFGVGPALSIPVRIHFNEVAALRLTVRGDTGFGSDTFTWAQYVDGQEVRLQSTDHWAMLTLFSFTGGLDVYAPGDLPITPYLGAEVGGAWVATYHSFGGDSSVLLDPEQNKLDSGGNIDPWASNLVLLTDVHFGLQRSVGDALALWFETGYALSFQKAATLKKSTPGLDARREAFAYNALRVGIGISFKL